MQAWKAMTGCDSYVKDGWVLAMKIHYFRHDSNNRCIVMGKVRHSQKINAAPVLPWVVLELNGTVLCAHCTCMAGAAESQKKFGEDACTSKKCSWLPAIKEVAPSEIVTVNFSSSTTDCAKTVSQCKLKPHHVVQPPTDTIHLEAATRCTSVCVAEGVLLAIGGAEDQLGSNKTSSIFGLHDVDKKWKHVGDMPFACSRVDTLLLSDGGMLVVDGSTQNVFRITVQGLAKLFPVTPTVKETEKNQNEADERLYEEAMSKGYVETSVTKCLILGAAGVGKTHLKHLLLKKDPPGQSVSTGLAENPVQAVSFSLAGVVGQKEDDWFVVEDDQALLRVVGSTIRDGGVSMNILGRGETCCGHICIKPFRRLSHQPTIELYGADGKPDARPLIITVGTHRDAADRCSESIKEKSQKLKALLDADSFHIMYNGEELEEVVFAVNGKTPQHEDRHVAKLLRGVIISMCPQPIKMPIAWFGLEVLLQRSSHDGILSLVECQEYAKRLRIEGDAFSAALHHLVYHNVFLHYPEVLPQTVFCDPQVVLTKLSEIVEYHHKLLYRPAGGVAAKGDLVTFRDHGQLSVEILNKFSKHYAEGLFTVQDLLKLLVSVGAIAMVVDDGIQYLMPALLPHLDSGQVTKYCQPGTSLIIRPTQGCIPSGLFCCLVAQFLSPTNHSPWKVCMERDKPLSLYRNCITFELKHKTELVTLVDMFSYIVLHIDTVSGIVSVSLDSEPSLQHLMEKVAAVIPSKYEMVGLQLGLTPAQLQAIRPQHQSLEDYHRAFVSPPSTLHSTQSSWKQLAKVGVQEGLGSYVPGFTFNLGFSGGLFSHGDPLEVEGSKEIVRVAEKLLWWFEHMYKHLKSLT
eukprot:Em0002g257a